MINSTQLVICTRNRISTLLKQIEHLSELSEMKNVQILIVDNSDEDTKGIHGLAAALRKYSSKFADLKMIKSKPGLVIARNEALKYSKTEFIIFIDDDVRLPTNFISVIINGFSRYPEIAGLAPLIEGLYESKSKFQRNVLKIFKVIQGKITPTSHAFWVDEKTEKDLYVDWLPGCCMAYRASKISGIAFSTDLLKGSTGGYSLGEDVDFSSRVSINGPLVCVVDAKIFHDLSDVNRSNDNLMQQAIGEWRDYASRNLNKTSYFATLVFELLYLLLSRFSGRSKYSRAKIRWHGFMSHRMLPAKNLITNN